ncbi:MAG: hypothetical protein EA349_11905 [Halomonadaceae bacterium]|nr:MAG: hypothetical protein EA349_11905 [Halomonadaceae bacterium]
MNRKQLIDTALQGLDNLGSQLANLGISNRVNRHSLIALVMAEQKRFEGELDSLNARVNFYRFRAEQTAGQLLKPVQAISGNLRERFTSKAS